MVNNVVLLGGISRSGTTLTCSLLNQVDNTLALVEPMNMAAFQSIDSPQGRVSFIVDYALEVREKVINGEPLLVKVIDGEETNTFAYSSRVAGKRKTVIKGESKKAVDRALSENFLLIIKHPNAFAALLSELCTQFSVFMHIRNPLSVLSSWHSLEHPLNRGHAPVFERFDSVLKKRLGDSG